MLDRDGIAHLIDILNDPEKEGLIPMQFTGLVDKNGKEIYEGDRLRYINNGKEYIMGFEDGMFDLINYDHYSHDQYRAFEDEASWELVGNIYENPELISK